MKRLALLIPMLLCGCASNNLPQQSHNFEQDVDYTLYNANTAKCASTSRYPGHIIESHMNSDYTVVSTAISHIGINMPTNKYKERIRNELYTALADSVAFNVNTSTVKHIATRNNKVTLSNMYAGQSIRSNLDLYDSHLELKVEAECIWGWASIPNSKKDHMLHDMKVKQDQLEKDWRHANAHGYQSNYKEFLMKWPDSKYSPQALERYNALSAESDNASVGGVLLSAAFVLLAIVL